MKCNLSLLTCQYQSVFLAAELSETMGSLLAECEKQHEDSAGIYEIGNSGVCRSADNTFGLFPGETNHCWRPEVSVPQV